MSQYSQYTYYLQKGLKHFGLEVLVVSAALEHFELYLVFVYNFLC